MQLEKVKLTLRSKHIHTKNKQTNKQKQQVFCRYAGPNDEQTGVFDKGMLVQVILYNNFIHVK